MPINLYGNINGTYQPSQINVFDLAKQQNNKPVKFCETELGKDNPVLKVNISKEGLLALHGSKLPGSVDIQTEQEQIKYASEHQPTESYYYRMAREMNTTLEQRRSENNGTLTLKDRENSLMDSFIAIADEIVSGYDSGTRVRFIEDSSSEDGYRRLTKEDELAVLQKEFDEFVDARFGKKHQQETELVMKQMEALQQIKAQMGRPDIKEYQPELIPEGFLERILERARLHIEGLK